MSDCHSIVLQEALPSVAEGNCNILELVVVCCTKQQHFCLCINTLWPLCLTNKRPDVLLALKKVNIQHLVVVQKTSE